MQHFARLALEREWTANAPDEWQQFLLMPFQHSESIDDQRISLREFRRLGEEIGLRYALLRLDQIERAHLSLPPMGGPPGGACPRHRTSRTLFAIAHDRGRARDTFSARARTRDSCSMRRVYAEYA